MPIQPSVGNNEEELVNDANTSFKLSPYCSGVLLSDHASKTLEYITHGSKMILCRGTCGHSRVEKASQAIREQMKAQDVLPQFDSLYLDPYKEGHEASHLILRHDDEYVIFHPAQFLPKYEIEFVVESLQLCSPCRYKLGHNEEDGNNHEYGYY
ncbi:hypothetical protein FDP41_013026 [Naegleria fowleri]|uniref:Uncharacterized protein n=1 Tax=Naegleria fowleri TaxID=5763 RepID=A0A6A5C5Y3_NAEFO|nr:uncharacterized protein FDP41_013026 [Naegleria fowleri]KAF0981238.1 hypothetical protein FDP41_013026 [Naegleria fowleri]CAG4716146.1 unnamed protein product [Naegleria fowleri]